MKSKIKRRKTPLLPQLFQIDKIYYVVYTMGTENGPYTFGKRYKLLKAQFVDEKYSIDSKKFIQITLEDVKSKKLQLLYIQRDNVYKEYAKILKHTFFVDPRTTLYKKLIYAQYYKYKTVKKQLKEGQQKLYNLTIKEFKNKDYKLLNDVTY